jgi:hypothetical protein
VLPWRLATFGGKLETSSDHFKRFPGSQRRTII